MAYSSLRRARGLTMVEVLVVIFVVALLLSVIMPGGGGSPERGNRIKCGGNLRGIGMALMMYGDQYKSYPMTDDNGCFSPEKVYELLATGGDMTPKVFICPSSSSEPEPTTTRLERSSYGFSCWNVKANKMWLTPRLSGMSSPLPADLIVAADRRNGGGSGTPQKSRQSKNHQGEGQNALYGDGHVEFMTNPYWYDNGAGVRVTDDIFVDEAIEPDTFLQD